LIESQNNYIKIGAASPKFLSFVRKPSNDEDIDVDWRPVDVSFDKIPVNESQIEYTSDTEKLYYWKKHFKKEG
jgi:hypothetical protein